VQGKYKITVAGRSKQESDEEFLTLNCGHLVKIENWPPDKTIEYTTLISYSLGRLNQSQKPGGAT
jgi:hypothetical protein